MRKSWISIAILGLLTAAAPAAEVDFAKAGMDKARLERIKPRMQQFADDKYVAGTVTLVMRRGELVHLEAAGWQDIEAKKPMRTDSIFQIMSMTKPVTGVAVMMMVEEGRLRLADPVEKHLPEFRGQLMIESKDGDRVTLKKPSRPITIRDLMTHTSGMAGGPGPGIAELLMRMDRSLAEAVAIYAQAPLSFEPGTKWQYSNTGIATLGRLVEVASGMPFEKFLDERIFKPLGMVDSHIFLPKEKRSRLAPVYDVKNGKLFKAGAELLAGDPMNYREGAKYSGPEYALYTTAPDLAKFYQMMLNGGKLGQSRILSPVSVEIMSKVHTGQIRAGWLKGTGFGLTWEVVSEPMGTLSGMAEGCFNHGGAFGTFGWVDPKREMVGVFMVQHDVSTFDARDAFIGMANTAIIDVGR
ncbi:MAG TPA: serine hydrolase domain-containing protein [Bryobacteraceae bacterium]|nr:serine hydrolase domain-containing protein [Bryobacteraceae bacterium]HPT26124.1 serine hydrolase domain-containing protein [Bryobacteraceae bacterium]